MKNLFQPCYAELPEDYNRDVIRCLQTSECIAKYNYKPWYFFENIIEWNNLISKLLCSSMHLIWILTD